MVNIKKNNLMRVALVFIIAALALVLAFALPQFNSAKAEGNDSGNPSANADITLNIDVNGIQATLMQGLVDQNAADITTNNTLHYKSRVLASTAIVAAYNSVHASAPIDEEAIFVDGSVKNSSASCSAVIENSQLSVTALSANTNARFSVQMSHANVVTTVYFRAVVTDTFVHLSERESGGLSDIAANDKRILVGNRITSNREEATAVPLNLSNYTDFTLDLDTVLNGRALYYNKTGATGYKTRAVMGNSENVWGLSSVKNFTVTALSFTSGAFTNVTFVNPTATERISPSVAAKLTITRTLISSYTDPVVNPEYTADMTYDQRENKFWSDSHNLLITFGELGTTVSYTVMVPVKFLPANPQVKSIDSALLGLNITSDYYYDLSSDTMYNSENVPQTNVSSDVGYSAIILRPSDLIEYSYPSTTYGGTMLFAANSETASKTSTNYRIEKFEGASDDYPSAYKLTLLANGSFPITFSVAYYSAPQTFVTPGKDVTISVTGYGNYAVTFTQLKGKHAIKYNVLTADEFSELIYDGYQMTSAKTLTPDTLTVELSNNTLTLTPNVANISGQTTSQVQMVFTNNESQSITILASVAIDVTAGSFFAMFEDWQAWLIIAACVVGGIIIVLLIVWIFIHSISKHKQEELATQAPVSSYIVKLNSTIAATQAQQRLAATQALAAQSSTMLLGAGPTSTQAPSPDTLQLAAGTAQTSAPSSQASQTEDSKAAAVAEEEDYNALIAKYISDEELLERIFIEKYEPKGMVRRTFFKSKDLQARELDKEKKRIIERYKSPMPMDEAIMSEAEVKKRESSGSESSSAAKESQVEPQALYVLDFDPDAPLIQPEPARTPDEFDAERIEVEVVPEESALTSAEQKNAMLEKEMAELKTRMDKVQSQLDKCDKDIGDVKNKINKAEEDDIRFKKDIEDLEFSLATAKQKEKDKITRDISIKEEQSKRNSENLEKLRKELDSIQAENDKLNAIKDKLTDQQQNKDAEQQSINKELEKAKADYEAYRARIEKVKARQEMDAKLSELSAALIAVNNADYESRQLQNLIENQEKERDAVKTEIASAKSRILSENDFDVINELNNAISESNAKISELEKELTSLSKRRSELNIEINLQRRKANDYIEKQDIPVEEVIEAEDKVIGNIEFDHLKLTRENDKEESEKAMAQAQAVYDDIAASSADVTFVAMEVASQIKEVEESLQEAQTELDSVNLQMETATDDEKLMLMVDQSDKQDKVNELTEKLKTANVEGTKRKMEAQNEYEQKVEDAKAKLDAAKNEYGHACDKYDEILNSINPLDLIMSGSGIISQDRKKIEAESLKKQLEKSKNEIEQARLAAQMAQMEAEQAKVDASRASDAAKAEAEKAAQEAIAKAEKARDAAEEKARAESEAAERAKQEAIEAAERAKQEAEEAAVRAKQEAEEAAERAKQEAEEAAERAKREAEEAAERAKREAEEAAAQEAEQAKQKAQEEIEEMKRKAEEEAEQKRKEEEERQKAEAERAAALAAKISSRKAAIIEIRNTMHEIKNDDDAKNMREKLYTMQLSFDADERGSSELLDFYNKTMDDIQHAGEVAQLKAENAKKPQRVVKKVTERVNRIPKRSGSGARTGARPGAARPGATRTGARPGAARPGATRTGARPGAARPGTTRTGARPGTTRTGARPSTTRPSTRPDGTKPTGAKRPSAKPPQNDD